MPQTFTCQHCGKIKPRNPRLKEQNYCSEKECQRVRMRFWKKEQYHKRKSYRKKHLDVQQHWRDHRPAHEYQREYRQDHPGYVKRNRELQLERNKKRQKELGPMIVNGNALSLQPSIDGSYMLFKAKKLNDCKWELVRGGKAGIIRARDDLTLE